MCAVFFNSPSAYSACEDTKESTPSVRDELRVIIRLNLSKPDSMTCAVARDDLLFPNTGDFPQLRLFQTEMLNQMTRYDWSGTIWNKPVGQVYRRGELVSCDSHKIFALVCLTDGRQVVPF
jgi:hypothetical protein